MIAFFTYDVPPPDFSPTVEAAGCFCSFQDQFLLLKRHPEKPQGETWGIPGGKLEKGETPLKGAIREVFEEVGIKLEEKDLQEMGKIYVRHSGIDWIFHMFFSVFNQKPAISLALDEHQEYRWITIDQALELPLISGGKHAILFYQNFLKTRLVNQIHEIEIHGLGASGEGVGSMNGMAVFVEGALPLEKVKIKISQLKKTYAKGQIKEIIQKSKERIEPPCPVFNQCGGCQIMHLSYPAQLAFKRQKISDALKRIGHLENVTIEECIASPSPFSYRNKIQLPILWNDQGVKVGLYAKNSHDIIPIDTCLIHCKEGEEVLSCLLSLTKDGNKEKGFKHLLIKSSFRKKESLVIFVTDSSPSPYLHHLAQILCKLCPQVKGVVHNRNPKKDNVILGTDFSTLCGVPYMYDQLCGLDLKISPSSFFQVNPAQAEIVYSKVLELAQLNYAMTFLDAYCGIGSFTLLAAKHCKEAFGIECVPQAILDAQENAERNHLKNCHFMCGKAENILPSLQKKWDVIFLNPPRKGCDSSLLQTICKNPPKTIIYMSCDPATLARDLSFLYQNKYQVDRIFPFDMFPQTSHVESVVKLQYT